MLDSARLTDALRRGHRPHADRRIGLEWERFVLRADGAPVPFHGEDGVEALLAAAARASGGKERREGGRLLGVELPDGAALSLEPGAQLEWSSAPCRGLPELAAHLRNWEEFSAELARARGLRLAAIGAHPTAAPEDLPLLPKERYARMEPWLRSRAQLGSWMMKCTCGVQANLDHADEGEAMEMLRAALRLAPLFNAIFANSAVAAGRASGFATWRERVWEETEPDRCGIPLALTRPAARFTDYAAWAWQAPMLFAARPEGLRDLRGTAPAAWFAGAEATEADWELHLSTLFPEARFRPRLELRSADSVPGPLALGYAALARALLERPAARGAALRLTEDWDDVALQAAWRSAHRDGLAGADPAGGRLLARARVMLAVAQPLAEEEAFLQPVRDLLVDGRSLGERTRDAVAAAPERAVALALAAG